MTHCSVPIPERARRKLLEDLSGLLDREAEFIQATEYGDKHRIRGTLKGPNGRQLRIVSVWMTALAVQADCLVTVNTARGHFDRKSQRPPAKPEA